MKLTKLNDQNYHLMREWRNENLNAFLIQVYVTPEMHEKWYEKYQSDPKELIYVVEHEGKSIGTVGLDLNQTPPSIERVMLGDKSYARQGLMGDALEKLCDMYNFKSCQLRVKADNHIAINFYIKHGFKEYDRIIDKDGTKIIKMIRNHE